MFSEAQSGFNGKPVSVKNDDGVGKSTVIRFIPHEEVINEMKGRGSCESEIKEFGRNARLDLVNKKKHFDCEIEHEDGAVERLDWLPYPKIKWQKEERRFFEGKR